ncbi:TPA: hypothetical protein QC102_004578, partial [Bacillus cereus]|nr:hypothetical protein [Bacillus cereus]
GRIETNGTIRNKKIGKNMVFIVLVLIFVITAVFVGMKLGFNNAKVALNDKKFTVKQLEKEITRKQEQNKGIKEELSKIENEYQEVKALIVKKEGISKDIEGLQRTAEQKKQENLSLDNQINEKKRELELLTKSVIEKKQEPRIMVAGTFTVGKDIPAGRYKVEPNKGSGNYFVNKGNKTNIILGNSHDNFLPEYVITLNEGDQIETNVSVKYTAVE